MQSQKEKATNTLIIHSEALYLLANAHYRLSEFQNAEDVFLKFIVDYPCSDLLRNSKYGLAWSYFQQEKYNDAYEVFNTLSLSDDSIGIYSFYWKAESKRYAGKTSEALAIFKEFYQKYPGSNLVSNAKYEVGGIYFTDNKFKDSEKYLLESVDSDNAIVKSKAYLLLGEMNLNNRNYSAAQENFKTTLSIADT